MRIRHPQFAVAPIVDPHARLPSQTSRSTEAACHVNWSAQLGPHLLSQRRAVWRYIPTGHPLDQAGDVGQNTQRAIYTRRAISRIAHIWLAAARTDRAPPVAPSCPRAAATTQSSAVAPRPDRRELRPELYRNVGEASTDGSCSMVGSG